MFRCSPNNSVPSQLPSLLLLTRLIVALTRRRRGFPTGQFWVKQDNIDKTFNGSADTKIFTGFILSELVTILKVGVTAGCKWLALGCFSVQVLEIPEADSYFIWHAETPTVETGSA